jgi:hypothetical protein
MLHLFHGLGFRFAESRCPRSLKQFHRSADFFPPAARTRLFMALVMARSGATTKNGVSRNAVVRASDLMRQGLVKDPIGSTSADRSCPDTYAEIFSFLPDEAVGTKLLASLSPSLSDPPCAAGGGAACGRGSGFNIRACVMPGFAVPGQTR